MWLGLILLNAIGLGGSILIALSPSTNLFPPWAAVTVIVGAVLSASTRIAGRLNSVRKGRLGERLVTDLLRALPDDYWLVNDLMLRQVSGNVDHVLIGPCGVVAIETKRLAGRIRCYGDEWSVNGRPRGSISRQVNSGAAAIRYYLAARHPDLASTALRWVESIVVFTHPTCQLEVNKARTATVRYSELPQLVFELANKHHLARSVSSRLAESLVALQASEVAVKRPSGPRLTRNMRSSAGRPAWRRYFL